MEITNNVLIVCTRNRREMLVALIQNIRGCAVAPGNVVIVDSSESTWDLSDFERLRAKMPFRLHYLTSRSGLPYQRNVGIAYAQAHFPSSELVHFLDDDVAVPSDYFGNVERVFAKRSDIVAVGAYDENYRQIRPTFLRRFCLLGSKLGQGRLLKSGVALAPSKPEKLTEVQWLPGFGISVRFQVLGPPNSIWNGRFRMYGEDVDACLAIGTIGVLVVDPVVHLKHFQAAAEREALPAIQYQSDVFRYRLAFEHSELVTVPAIIWATAALLAGELALYIYKRDLGHAAAASGHLRFLKDFVLRRVAPQEVDHDYQNVEPLQVFS